MHRLLLTLFLLLPLGALAQPGRPWQLIHDVSHTLRDRHGYTGRNIHSEGGLSWKQFRDALSSFQGPLEQGPFLDLSLGRNLILLASAHPKINRFPAGWFSLYIPARTHPPALIPLIESILQLHYKAMGLELTFKNHHGLCQNGVITFEEGISIADHRRGLDSLASAINHYEPEEGARPLFEDTRGIFFVDSERVRLDQHIAGIDLEIPISLGLEDYESQVFFPLTLWSARKRVKFLLRDYYRYRGDNAPTNSGGIAPETFKETLEMIDELLRPAVGQEESRASLDMSNVRHVFISPGDRPWTRRYIGGQVGLHIPVDLPREHMVAALEMALFSTDDLEARVMEEFKIRGFNGENLQYHMDKRRANYRIWIENLWLAAKAAPEESFLRGAEGISITTSERPRASVGPDGVVHLDIPLESDPANLFNHLGPLVERTLLRRAIEHILWAHDYPGNLEIALGFHEDKLIAEGFRRVKEGLEDKAPSIPDLSSMGRLTLSRPGEKPWAYSFGNSVYLHIPMDTPASDIVPLITDYLQGPLRP